MITGTSAFSNRTYFYLRNICKTSSAPGSFIERRASANISTIKANLIRVKNRQIWRMLKYLNIQLLTSVWNIYLYKCCHLQRIAFLLNWVLELVDTQFHYRLAIDEVESSYRCLRMSASGSEHDRLPEINTVLSSSKKQLYKLIKVIGEGGFGCVFLAYSEKDKR